MEPITIKIGRDPKNDLIIEDKSADWVHADLFLNKANEWEIVDLNSKTGVWINQKKIEGSHKIHFGDEIRIGFQIIDWNLIKELQSKKTELLANEKKGNLNTPIGSIHQASNGFEKKESDSTLDKTTNLSITENKSHLNKEDEPLINHSKSKSEFKTQVRIVKGTSINSEEKVTVKTKKSNDLAFIMAAILVVILMLAAGYFISHLV
jgi:pSer/pThr/pTyr-binding forkhead associated (FHA) protein